MRVPDTLNRRRGYAQGTCVPGLTVADLQKKSDKIRRAIELKDVPLLRRLSADTGGLLDDEFRETAWPIMLGIDPVSTPDRCSQPVKHEPQSTPFYDQVVRDVHRTTRRFPPSTPKTMILRLQESLLKVISRVLTAAPDLHYYQGYHDICLTVLLVVEGDEEAAFPIIEQLSRTKLRAFMESSIKETTRQLDIIYPLLGSVSPPLRKFLEETKCGVVFLLSWCLTWYGHEVSHYLTLVRLFDLFIASDELMPVYLAAAIILPHQEELLKQECSLAAVHGYLGRLLPLVQYPRGDMEELVITARDLLRRFPSRSLLTLESDRQSGPFRTSDTALGWEKIDPLKREQVGSFLLDDYVIVTYRRDSTDSSGSATDLDDEVVDSKSRRQSVEFMTTAC